VHHPRGEGRGEGGGLVVEVLRTAFVVWWAVEAAGAEYGALAAQATEAVALLRFNAARRYLRACRYSVSWPPEVRGRACAKAASASYASYRSDSI
jgi:hypothetical protein